MIHHDNLINFVVVSSLKGSFGCGCSHHLDPRDLLLQILCHDDLLLLMAFFLLGRHLARLLDIFVNFQWGMAFIKRELVVVFVCFNHLSDKFGLLRLLNRR